MLYESLAVIIDFLLYLHVVRTNSDRRKEQKNMSKKQNVSDNQNQIDSVSTARPAKHRAIQVINFSEVAFEHPLKDVHVARILIANASWIETTNGVVVVDTLLNPSVGKKMVEKIHENGKKIKYMIYTHGHLDHVGGASAFLSDAPAVIAHRYVIDRFEKYQILREHRERIAEIQFNFAFHVDEEAHFVNPDQIYDESMTFKLGDKT